LKINHLKNRKKSKNKFRTRENKKTKTKIKKRKNSARRPPAAENVTANMSDTCKFFLHAILTVPGAMGDPLPAIFFEYKTQKNLVFKTGILKTPTPRLAENIYRKSWKIIVNMYLCNRQ